MRKADFVCPTCGMKEERILCEEEQFCKEDGTKMRRKFSAPAIIIR